MKIKKLKIRKKVTAVVLSFVLVTTMNGFGVVSLDEAGMQIKTHKVVRMLPTEFSLKKELDYEIIKKGKEKSFVKTKTVKPKIRRNN